MTAFIHRAGGLLVVWCGCLYRGTSIVTGAEAGTLIADAYHRDGARGVQRLTGSYAGVVVDEARATTVLIRSPLGERPLFWRLDGSRLLVASEVKQVVAGGSAEPEVDHDALWDLVAFNDRAPARTAYRGIERVLAGSWIEVTDAGPRRHRFWTPEDVVGTARISRADAVEGFRHHLRVAVERRLRDGTRLLLSGGLDSSAVAWAAAPLPVVTARYPDHPEADETGYVKATAAALGLEPVWVFPEPHPFRGLDEAAWLHDGPEIAPMSSNFREILAAAKGAGTPTVLDGHDGDTVLGASTPGVPSALLRRGHVGTFARYVAFRRRRLSLSRRQAVRRIVAPAIVDLAPALRRLRRRPRPAPAYPPSWVGPDLRERILEGRAKQPVWREAHGELLRVVLPRAIEHFERLALVEDVTLLHPFSDPDLVDFVVRLPPEMLYATGAPKSLVRLGCGTLPGPVRWRMEKTLFDGVALAGSPPEEILQELEGHTVTAFALDEGELRAAIVGSELRFAELALLHRVLSAARFLDSNRTDRGFA